MAGTINPGDAITALDTIIAADHGAIFDAIDTEHSATGAEVLDDIEKIWTAPQVDGYAAGDIPALVLVSFSSALNTDISTYAELHFEHVIQGLLIVRGNDRITGYAPNELLNLKLERMVRGLIEVVQAKPRLTISAVDKCDQCIITSVRYSSVGETDSNQLEKRARMDFEVHTSA